MITKSINMKHDDAVSLADIISKDNRFNGPSEALKYCFEDAAREIPHWEKVIEQAKKLDYKADIQESDIGATRTFLVEEEVYMSVLESVKEQFKMKKPQASFLTRLCLSNARIKFYFTKNKDLEIKAESIDAAELLLKVQMQALKLLKKGEFESITKFLEMEV